jgi:transposase
MKYVGLDVHVKKAVWCCLDETGEIIARGKTPTTPAELMKLAVRLQEDDDLLLGQEAGKMSHLVHDVLTSAGVRLLTFNAHHLKVIASSRKKSDKRDSYWLAKALQTGMMPHPVYIPTGEVRELRGLLSQREALVTARTSWLVRAKTLLTAAGHPATPTPGSHKWLHDALQNPDGLDALTADRVEQCERIHLLLTAELQLVDASIHAITKKSDVVQRLQTIPAVGEKVAVALYAWIGDVTRFPNARRLCSYAGLVPSVRQSADSTQLGGITKEGSSQLRRLLVQAGHVLLWKCNSDAARPLRALPDRVANKGKRKVGVVAAARHILKIAYYVMRDGGVYDPTLLRSTKEKEAQLPAA